MMSKLPDDTVAHDELSQADLADEMAVDLPEREAMSTVGRGFGHGIDHFVGNVAIPINEATAENLYTNNSVAAADAEQIVILNQTTTKT
jgi:hypothetical protein